MVFPALIPLALGIASEFGPGLVRMLAGDKAGEVADQVVSVAKSVAGADTPDEAAAIARANPEVAAKLRQALAETEVQLEQTRLQEETKRLQEVNETIRTEVASDDKYVRRWRPTFGYVAAASWGFQMMAVSWLIVSQPQYAGEIITAMSSLTVIWSVFLAVVGVNVHARSRDKAVAAGSVPQSAIQSLIERVTGGGK